MPGINNNTHVPVSTSSYVSNQDLDTGATASSGGASSAAPPKGEGHEGLRTKYRNKGRKYFDAWRARGNGKKSQESKSSLYQSSQDDEAAKPAYQKNDDDSGRNTSKQSDPLIGGRSLRLQNDKKNSVPPPEDGGVSNKDQFALSTEEQLDSLFDIFDSLPAKQKAEAEQKFVQLKTSMKACKSDDERKMVLQNAIASMQELVSQMPADSQPGMREKLSKLSNSLKEIKIKSGDNEGPEKKAPSLESMSFSDMKNMSKEQLLEQQQQQSWEAMMIQIVLTNMQILTEIVKKGTSIAAGAIQ